jgi:hypothetical protein
MLNADPLSSDSRQYWTFDPVNDESLMACNGVPNILRHVRHPFLGLLRSFDWLSL